MYSAAGTPDPGYSIKTGNARLKLLKPNYRDYNMRFLQMSLESGNSAHLTGHECTGNLVAIMDRGVAENA